MKTLFLPVLLQLLGVAVIIVDFIVPSFGVLTAIAICMMLWSLIQTFASVSAHAGTIMICADLLILPVVVVMGFKVIARSPLALRSTLSSKSGVTSQAENLASLEGKVGKTVSQLRPAGIALIGGMRVDVVSRGEFIAKDEPVVVTAVTGNQVIVKKQT